MRKLFVFLSLLALVSKSAAAYCSEPETGSIVSPFPAEAPTVVENVGTSIFLDYDAGLQDARSSDKPLIVVLFSKEPSGIFSPFFGGNVSFGEDIDPLVNIVILQPSLISPLVYPPKMDPMILRVGDFQAKFASYCDFSEKSYIFVVDTSSEGILFQMPVPSQLESHGMSILDLLQEVFGSDTEEFSDE